MTDAIKATSSSVVPATDGNDVIGEMTSFAVTDTLNAVSDMVCVCIDGVIRHINTSGVAILGAANREALIGLTFQNLICDDFAATIDDILAVIADETNATPMHVKCLNGKLESLAIQVKRLPELGSHAYVVIGQSLTRQVELSAALHQGEVRFRKLVHSALDLICVLDDGIVSYINQAGLLVLKATHESEVVGKPFSAFLHPDYQEIFDGDISELADENMLIRLRLNDLKQNYFDGEMGITVLETAKTVRCMIEVRDITAHNRAVTALRQSIETLEQRVEERTRELQEEVTERRRAEEMLRHVASHDGLTDLPNRSLLMDRLNKAIHRAHRDSKKCAVMFIDLDGFKPINDTLGHDMGDLLLRVVANRLTATIRETDTAARFGGDEFVLILTDLDKADDALPVGKKILDALRQPVDLNGNDAHIGASIGIAAYPDHGLNAEEVLKQADTAMYAVKESGKNAYVMASQEAS